MNTTPNDIFQAAADRGRERQLAYAGVVTPTEAWQLAQAGAARIVDVRTEAEWLYVGHIPGSQRVEWRRYKAPETNPDFMRELAEVAGPDEPLLLLCRSAQRSHQAAVLATAHGYTRCYNILEGFEGDIDDSGQRGGRGGWRRAGLPWQQT